MKKSAVHSLPPVPIDSVQEENALYGEGTEGQRVKLELAGFRVDALCAQCGVWRSEHDWDACRAPEWMP